MKIAINSDHAGFEYKESVRAFLITQGHEVVDFGTFSEEAVDYPAFAGPAAKAVADGKVERGIVVGTSGHSEAILANRLIGVRCALCWNADSARLSRQHDDANVLSIGKQVLTIETAIEIVRIWLHTPFDGGRHERRLSLIDQQARAFAARQGRT